MEYYAGIDVSLESSSVCVMDATGRIVREGKVASEPEAASWPISGWRSFASAWKPGRSPNGCTLG